jgi:hypothetical protein
LLDSLVGTDPWAPGLLWSAWLRCRAGRRALKNVPDSINICPGNILGSQPKENVLIWNTGLKGGARGIEAWLA